MPQPPSFHSLLYGIYNTHGNADIRTIYWLFNVLSNEINKLTMNTFCIILHLASDPRACISVYCPDS